MSVLETFDDPEPEPCGGEGWEQEQNSEYNAVARLCDVADVILEQRGKPREDKLLLAETPKAELLCQMFDNGTRLYEFGEKNFMKLWATWRHGDLEVAWNRGGGMYESTDVMAARLIELFQVKECSEEIRRKLGAGLLAKLRRT